MEKFVSTCAGLVVVVTVDDEDEGAQLQLVP